MVRKSKDYRNNVRGRAAGSRGGGAWRWVAIAVIVIAMVAATVAVVFMITYDKEKDVKGQLDRLAAEYYEEVVYPGLIKDGMSQAEINELMDRYVMPGFAPVKLRQLLLRDGGAKGVNVEMIREHCDENWSYVDYYPEEPYDAKSYRVEWTYDCDYK